ncbi:MAG: transglycosylase SLT domain-containing protein [Acidobacteriota bacterium]
MRPHGKILNFFARHGALVTACVPLLALALSGCQGSRRYAAPGSAGANSTAPGLQPRASSLIQNPVQSAAQAQQAQAIEAARRLRAEQHQQQVQELIARAEASYQAGVQNYNNNRLDAARQDFDFAVDTMLTSGMDLKNDPQLADAFDQLLSAINSLEMFALKQGSGFSEQIQEAPAQAANEVTFPANPELVGKIATQLKTTKSDLPLVVNDYVAGWINYFTNSRTGHAHLESSLERAGRYSAMISKDLAAQGVPQDLIYLAVAESGFQPQAVNPSSGAGGMWQFMPFSGPYGLERNGFFDERFDPEQSTLAYARYMKELHDQFGDWYLAMAAYNWGPGNVQRAVARTGYADYWELYRLNALPAETKAYVPSIIAAAIMAKNPKLYGLADMTPDPPVLFDDVTTTYAIDMRLVADLTNSTLAEIVSLNPALLRLSTPEDIPYDLHLPAGSREMFLARLQNIPEEDRTRWRFHVVQNGEDLEQIAASLHASAGQITSVNDLTGPVQPGDELVIPLAASSRLTPGTRYRMRRKDTLVTVADRFGVSVEQLRRWNHLRSNYVRPGRSIYVVEPIRLASSPRIRRRRSLHRRPVRRSVHPTNATSRRRVSHGKTSPHPSSRKQAAGKNTKKTAKKTQAQ